MGVDPPKADEIHMVCIEVKGPLTKQQFDEYQRAINACLAELRRRFKARRGTFGLLIRPDWKRGGRRGGAGGARGYRAGGGGRGKRGSGRAKRA